MFKNNLQRGEEPLASPDRRRSQQLFQIQHTTWHTSLRAQKKMVFIFQLWSKRIILLSSSPRGLQETSRCHRNNSLLIVCWFNTQWSHCPLSTSTQLLEGSKDTSCILLIDHSSQMLTWNSYFSSWHSPQCLWPLLPCVSHLWRWWRLLRLQEASSWTGKNSSASAGPLGWETGSLLAQSCVELILVLCIRGAYLLPCAQLQLP